MACNVPINTEVIVVGAGLSGLAAAKFLHERGVDVVVLEARDRVGGRTYTKEIPNYGWVDLGASYVGPTQNHILRLAKEMNVKTYRVSDGLDYVHYRKGTRTSYRSQWPEWPEDPTASWEINYLMDLMDKMIEEIPREAPWNAPHAKEWDNMTVQQFFDRNCTTEAAKNFGRSFCQTNVTGEPWELSLLWFLWYVRCCNGTKCIWNVTNGAQERKLEGGTQQISQKVAQKLYGIVRLNSPVAKLVQHDDYAFVQTLDGTTYKGRYVIMAIPPPLLMKIHYDPPLPPAKHQMLQRLHMGVCIKCEIYYKKPFWREKGMNGFITSSDDIEFVGNVADDCRPGFPLAALTGFIYTSKVFETLNLSKEDRKKAVTRSLARIYGAPEALEPLHYEDQNWLAEQYTGGCYTTNYVPGVLTQFGNTLREQFGRTFFAGTETAVEWSGYMNGAVEAGERAAREALHAMGRIGRNEIWVREPEAKLDVPSHL